MREFLVTGNSLPEAYHKALTALDHNGEVCDCADWGCKQKEVSMTMVVEEPLKEPMISKLFIGGPKELEQYRLEMLDGILDFEIEKGNWVYTYHDRMVNYGDENIDQIQFIVDELKRNPSSRRAVMLVRDKSDIGSDDPACLQLAQFFIRDEKLHCKIIFRSNDACKATFMNAFALIMLQKRIADELGIPVGTYMHRANSFHCYEKDFELLHGYSKRIFEDTANRFYDELEESDIVFDYVDDWKDMMDEYLPEIMSTVEELKNR